MTLPAIDVDGRTIKPFKGKYFCPHKCGHELYGLRSWKTEKGIRKHMAECPKGDAGQKLAAEKAAELKDRFDKFIAGYAYKYAQGDVIHFVHRRVVKPMFDSRGRKIRYEEVCRFSAVSTSIIEPSAYDVGYEFRPGYTTNGGFVSESDVILDLKEAEAKAAEQQKAHEEHLAFSSFCR